MGGFYREKNQGCIIDQERIEKENRIPRIHINTSFTRSRYALTMASMVR